MKNPFNETKDRINYAMFDAFSKQVDFKVLSDEFTDLIIEKTMKKIFE